MCRSGLANPFAGGLQNSWQKPDGQKSQRKVGLLPHECFGKAEVAVFFSSRMKVSGKLDKRQNSALVEQKMQKLAFAALAAPPATPLEPGGYLSGVCAHDGGLGVLSGNVRAPICS